MTRATLFGEITPDHQRIILVSQGNAWDQNEIAARVRRLTMPVRDVEPAALKAVSVPATWAAVTQLSFSFPAGDPYGGPRWVPGAMLSQWIITELTRRTALPGMAAYPEYPPWLRARPYQDAGAAAIAQTGRFLLFDEPGTGKTVTTLLGLQWRAGLGHAIFPLIILVPSWAVARGWAREIAAWLPGWQPPVLWSGPGREELAGTADTYITTYATARKDAADIKGPLVKLKPATTVIDEAHLTKSPDALQSKAALRLAHRSANLVGLTGTPVTVSTRDAWALLNAADPDSFPAVKRFITRLCETRDDGYGEKVEGLKLLAQPEFFAATTGTMRRVTKAEVLPQLPRKIYSVREVTLPPEWQKAYAGMVADMLAELPDGGEIPVMDALAQRTRLAQLACSAADVEVTEETDEETGIITKHYEITLKPPSWKADELMEILAERRGQPVIAFAPSRQLMMIAGKQAEQAGYRTGYLTGLGQGMTAKRREADLDAFRAGELDLLAATTEAGGVGIDGLQVAGTAVFLQRPQRLDSSIQSEDRVHRIGSEIHAHGVEIIDVIARGTIDEVIRDALREHGGQLGAFLRDPDFVRQMFGGLE